MSTGERLAAAKKLVQQILEGSVTPTTHAQMFDEDAVFLTVRLLEQEDPAWLIQALRERDTIAYLARREPIVMATGGGAILAPENRRLLRDTGTVVFLQTSLAQQLTVCSVMG